VRASFFIGNTPETPLHKYLPPLQLQQASNFASNTFTKRQDSLSHVPQPATLQQAVPAIKKPVLCLSVGLHYTTLFLTKPDLTTLLMSW